MAEKEINITVNGETYSAKSGENVLQVLIRNGIRVPHFCYHPKLSPAGACRMCLVEVEGARKLEVSCALPVRDGMVVQTESQKVKDGRQFVMEFTLVNHPIDCPICDQAGECWLQEYYMAHDRLPSHMQFQKVQKDKAKTIGPRVVLDQERCILCTRCVRFTDEITKTSELGIFNRGDKSELDVAPGQTLDNDYSENVIDICPVGALTSKKFRFDGRVWFLKETPSICTGCARGCNIVLQHREDKIRRILPRVNEEVNGHWMCDAGRDIHEAVHAENRLSAPQVKSQKEVSWAQLFEQLGERLNKMISQKQGAKSCVMGSAWASNEENFMALEFAHQVLGIEKICHQDVTPVTWERDDLLKVTDRSPNAKGAEMVAKSVAGSSTKIISPDQVIKDIQSGAISNLIILNQDIIGKAEASVKSKWLKALQSLDLLVVFETHQNETTQLADFVLPIPTFAEQNGSFVNVDGINQKFEKAIEPDEHVLSLMKVLPGLAKHLGKTLTPKDEKVPEPVRSHFSQTLSV